MKDPLPVELSGDLSPDLEGVSLMNRVLSLAILLSLSWLGLPLNASAQSISPTLHARIIQLEDERNLNGDELTKLLKHTSPKVRERAALAIGRIGDKRGTDALIDLFNQDRDANVQAMAAFALGEMEDVKSRWREKVTSMT